MKDNKEILVVEDSMVQRELLRRSLMRAGYEVLAAKNGVEGLTLTKSRQPALIISDIAMPEMDGYEMCFRIKTDEELKHIPVILLTALSDTKEIIRGLQSEADYYITKPYDEVYVLQSIDTILNTPGATSDTASQDKLEISLMGEVYEIKSKPKHILNLLLSTYENAVRKNRELLKAQIELETLNEELEDKVKLRTKELRHSEESYRVLFENTFSGFYRFDTEGRLLSMNPAFISMLGFSSQEDLLSVNADLPALYIKRVDYDRFFSALVGQSSTKDSISRLRKKDGGELIIEQNIRIVKDDDGKPLYYEGFVNDVTECKQAEEQLIKLSSAIVQSPVAVVITDLKGRIDFVNPKFVTMTGYTRDEVMGKTPNMLQSGSTPRAIYVDLWKSITAGNTWHGELLNKRKNNTFYWNNITISPIRDAEGNITHYLSVNEDITERKEIEEALKKAKEASEVANKAKSEFLANITHEIRTPMNAIIGMTEFVLDTELKKQQRDYLDLVLTSANSLLTILNSILDFSKIEAGKLDIESIAFDIYPLVENIFDTLSMQAHKKGIELYCRIKPNVPTRLIGDPARLSQVIINIVGNAIKFTEEGEVAAIVNIEPDSLDGNTIMLHFSVSDTGIGIQQDKIDYIFSTFSQADGSTTRKYGGTGLGLTISRQLVSLMGGDIWVESKEGSGSTFHFTVMVRLKDINELNRTMPELDLGGKKLLTICTYATSCTIIKEMLSDFGADIKKIKEPGEALEELGRARDGGSPYDIVFVDVRIAETGGFKVAEQITQDPTLARFVVIILNSNYRTGDMERCAQIGLAGYIIKPIKYKDVISTVQRLLNHPAAAGVPLLMPSKPEPSKAEVVKESTVEVRILLVEDNATNRLLASEVLKKQGYTVTEAIDGAKAVEMLKNTHFDIILMDVHMPVMDGFEATKIIKASPTTHSIPIIAMTAYAMKGDRERCLAAGMDDYITKPIRANDLIEIIKRYGPEESLSETTQIPITDDIKLLARQAMQKHKEIIETKEDDNLTVFFKKASLQIYTVKEAFDTQDNDAIERLVSKLKKETEKAGLTQLQPSAFRVLLAIRKGDINTALKHFQAFEDAFNKLTENRILSGDMAL
ncbi:sensory box histidine kinase/response regulator [Candidatus Magnetobacterium bavaricum]|uniref:Sensory/regulatory protein RpfC n=1 Tax=Candidatus Magnetobacterium bavaricum TaxID=29290 RepID=A0A0F3GQN9_9BACT|nr:sensory box histidine kinase/response regulator [Candidatus Magnetobacterium bavaricum]